MTNEPLQLWLPRSSIHFPQVLCIHQSRTLGVVLQRLLRHYQFQFALTDHPQLALSILLMYTPDLIILDPATDDYAAAQTLQQTDAWKAIPLLALTASQRRFERTRAKMVGFRAYLALPLEPQELLETVQFLLQ